MTDSETNHDVGKPASGSWSRAKLWKPRTRPGIRVGSPIEFIELDFT